MSVVNVLVSFGTDWVVDFFYKLIRSGENR